MELIALKSFPFGGRRVSPGDPPFSATKKDAMLLVALKLAEYNTRDMKAEGTRIKRKYKRRDMKAND